jgi:epoxyqueuosine reductase
LLTDIELDYDDPFEVDHCGTCTACLEACPTAAFPQPYVLDARRCISYLTIEHRGDIAEELRGHWDEWLFGCDICQEVCPWNNRVPPSAEPTFRARVDQNPMQLAELFYLDDEQFRLRFRKTPLWRSKRRGILRNAALVLGSQRDRSALPALRLGSADKEELVRNASDWAIGRIRNSDRP